MEIVHLFHHGKVVVGTPESQQFLEPPLDSLFLARIKKNVCYYVINSGGFFFFLSVIITALQNDYFPS